MKKIDTMFTIKRNRPMTAPWTKEEIIDFVEEHGGEKVKVTLAVGGEEFVVRAKVPSSFREIDAIENMADPEAVG